MDNLFANRKSGKYLIGHTWCQIFVTEKGFVYVVPIKSKVEVIQALNQFTK